MAAHGAAFDLVVIGSGPAGRPAAGRAAKLEKSLRKKKALYPNHQAQAGRMGQKRCDRMSVIGPPRMVTYIIAVLVGAWIVGFAVAKALPRLVQIVARWLTE